MNVIERLKSLGYPAMTRGRCVLVMVGTRVGYVLPESITGSDDEVREVLEGVKSR